jgi:hypothetical protein
MGYLRAHWEKWVTIDHLKQARADLDEIWKTLLAAAKLEVFDTLICTYSQLPKRAACHLKQDIRPLPRREL